MTRALAIVVTIIVAIGLWLVVSTRSTAETSQTITPEPNVGDDVGVLVGRVTNDAQVETLKRKLKRSQRRLYFAHVRQHQLKRVLMHSSSVHEVIDLACIVYGSCTTLWRKASCESGYSPTAHNGSGASGLFQFLGSTWRSTPYGTLSVWSPYANALAAGWMHAHGRGGEWVCQ